MIAAFDAIDRAPWWTVVLSLVVIYAIVELGVAPRGRR